MAEVIPSMGWASTRVQGVRTAHVGAQGITTIVTSVALVALLPFPPVPAPVGGELREARRSHGPWNRPDDEWSLEEAEAVQQALAARGWDYDRLANRLQGPDCGTALNTILSYADRTADRYAPPDPFSQMRFRLLLAQDLPAELPPNVSVVTLRNARVAVLSPIESWLNLADMQYCAVDPSAPAEASCMWVSHPAAAHREWAMTPWADPEVTWYPPPARVFGRDEVVKIPLVTTSQTRWLSVIPPYDYRDSARCTWRIESVQGVTSSRTETPGTVRLEGHDGAIGQLVVRRAACSGAADVSGPRPVDGTAPCFLETLPGEAAIFLQ